MEMCVASDGFAIKEEKGQFALFISGSEIDRSRSYDRMSNLATEVFIGKTSNQGDEFIGRRMFAPSSVGDSTPVVVTAKTATGYIVQRSDSDFRYEVPADCLSETPEQFF